MKELLCTILGWTSLITSIFFIVFTTQILIRKPFRDNNKIKKQEQVFVLGCGVVAVVSGLITIGIYY